MVEPDPYWYKDAILYELHVRSFYDSDGDGWGDFRGLAEKLDYLQDLGVTGLWLLPFYPSPLKDDGYDIADYTGIHPTYGTLADFKSFLQEAHRRGLRVITELVLNHTSDQHPWFQRARRAAPGSAARDFYVWSDTPERYREARIIFKDFELSNWAWDPLAKAYYWHRFYAHQPDLNYNNPAVWEAIFPVVDFWRSLGVDGLRLDAVPYLYEREGTSSENLSQTHQFLRALRRHVDARFSHRLLLAEANQWPEDACAYFGQEDECHIAFHFPLMPRLFMAIHTGDRLPITDILAQTPPIPESCQWALFLRNHDELTLEMVTDEERCYLYLVCAQDQQARINLGIRRRLAPLLGNNRQCVELMNGLLFSLLGTPVLYYGDEIGMGDNIYLGDRDGVRTPMQWSPDLNAGFSRANPQQLYLPPIIDPEYHYQAVNVAAQQDNPQSLWWGMKRLIALRKRYQAFSRGSLELLYSDNPRILAFVRHYRDEILLVVANLSRFVQPAALDLAAFQGRTPVELFGRTAFPVLSRRPFFLTLAPHAFYWFALEPRGPASPCASAAGPEARVPVLTVLGSWDHVLRSPGKTALEAVLPAYLQTCRWFGGKTRLVEAATIREIVPLAQTSPAVYLTLLQVEYLRGVPETYAIPFACAAGAQAERLPGARLGTRGDALRPEPFSPLYQRAFYQSMRGLTVRVWRRLGEHWKHLPASVRTEAQALLDSQDAVLQRFHVVLERKITALRLRCHGDYHLRQVLCTGEDVAVIDFEGEPDRLLAERQLKRCPLLDVAGMLRSFHYAAYAARWDRAALRRTTPRPAAAALEYWTRFWCAWVSAAFLRDYLALAPQMAFLPQTREELTVLCEVYLLEKAVYELGYELEHRPAWVRLPLRGILQLLGLCQ